MKQSQRYSFTIIQKLIQHESTIYYLRLGITFALNILIITNVEYPTDLDTVTTEMNHGFTLFDLLRQNKTFFPIYTAVCVVVFLFLFLEIFVKILNMIPVRKGERKIEDKDLLKS